MERATVTTEQQGLRLQQARDMLKHNSQGQRNKEAYVWKASGIQGSPA